MRRIRVSADYRAFPVWDLEDGSMVDPTALPIGADLVAGLQTWADRFDATLDDHHPLASGFASPVEQAAFVRDGEELARQLKEQLGAGFDVQFGDDPV